MTAQPNPYAPPLSRLDLPQTPPAIEEIATTGQRFANSLIDYVGTSVIGALVGVTLGLVDESLLEGANEYLFGFAIWFVYYSLSEGLTGRTPAKLITGTKVVSEDGRPPSFSQIMGRTFSRLVPFEAFSFLGDDGRPVGWHDAWSRTRVVRTRAIARSGTDNGGDAVNA